MGSLGNATRLHHPPRRRGSSTICAFRLFARHAWPRSIDCCSNLLVTSLAHDEARASPSACLGIGVGTLDDSLRNELGFDSALRWRAGYIRKDGWLARVRSDLRVEHGTIRPESPGARNSPSDRVVCVGDSCIDAYIGGRTAVGGNALNVSVNLARLGFDAEYVGVVGDDSRSGRIRNALKKEGVRVERVQVRVGPSWVSYIASFLAHRLNGGSIADSMEVGSRAAARTCLHWAAWSQGPAPSSARAAG